MECKDILWQGIHICVETTCPSCHLELYEDLEVGQALFSPYKVDLKSSRLHGKDKNSDRWFGLPLLHSLSNPQMDEVNFSVEIIQSCHNAIILNCLDYIFGHALLKLLNADRIISQATRKGEWGLVIMIQPSLRWLIPEGVAEVWTVNLPFKRAQHFYPRLNTLIKKECLRFKQIKVDLAFSHPTSFDITTFTKIGKYSPEETTKRITFIWREDRPWIKNSYLRRGMPHFQFLRPCLIMQHLRVRMLFSKLMAYFPDKLFTITGLGTYTKFPAWIDDQRFITYTDDIEQKACQIYKESQIIIGIHGSHLLLPSAHAGITVDLMPNDRWGNLAQDILYQEDAPNKADSRIVSLAHHYIPLDTSLHSLFSLIKALLQRHETLKYYYLVSSSNFHEDTDKSTSG